jgi:hypothetical protein
MTARGRARDRLAHAIAADDEAALRLLARRGINSADAKGMAMALGVSLSQLARGDEVRRPVKRATDGGAYGPALADQKTNGKAYGGV